MRQKNNRTVVILKTTKSIENKSWFEKNQGLIQFILVVVTILTLGVTIYFSNQSIKISSSQLKQAEKQLKLAQEQFKESQKENLINRKEKIADDKLNEKRFETQNSINQKNLVAIELQAKISEKQYQAQIEAAKDQVYQNRPIFMIGDSKYDSINNLITLTLKNIGKRPAKINRSIFFAYNKKSGNFKANISSSNSAELNESSFTIFKLPMTANDYADNNNMLYYLYFDYEDIVSSKNNSFFKYFNIGKTDKTVVWSDLLLIDKELLNEQAKMKNIILKF
jgi:type II secretory pathway pseudopilin PulG